MKKQKKKYITALLVVLVAVVAILSCNSLTSETAATSVSMPTIWYTSTPIPVTPTATAIAKPSEFITFDFGLDEDAIMASTDFYKLSERILLYQDNTASTHTVAPSEPPAIQQVGGITIDHVLWNGDGKWHEVFYVDKSYCQKYTVGETFRIYVAQLRNFGIPLKFGLPLIQSESNFESYTLTDDGRCKVKQNKEGAPAYTGGQIYKDVHQDLDWTRMVLDPNYPAYVTAAFYHGMYKRCESGQGDNDWLDAAACYKGMMYKGMRNNPIFIANYMPGYNQGSYTYRGITIPYNDTIDSVLSQIP